MQHTSQPRCPWIPLPRFFATLMLTAALVSCAEQPVRTPPPTTPVPTAGATRTTSTPKACVGPYSATRLSGDFAGSAGLEQFIDQMVRTQGFEREYLLGLFSQAKRKNWTLSYYLKSDQTLKAPPAPGSWSRYRAKFLDERHIGAGAAFAHRYREALQRATKTYGVPQEYILGILAVETTFGGFVGKDRVLDALTTLGFEYPRRGDYFRDELASFLVMTRNEGLDPAKPLGSFAGAMGLGQFMPSSFLRWAVDFNHDGHTNLWDPEDAIGSVANYFAQHGWQPGSPVVTPVQTKGPVALECGFTLRYRMGDLQQAGIQPLRPCPATGNLALLQLRHQNRDEYLIGHSNFYVITRYNNSTYYAMTVHELAQAIKQRI